MLIRILKAILGISNAPTMQDEVDGIGKVDPPLTVTIGKSGTYIMECYGPDGKLKWRETLHNTVIDACTFEKDDSRPTSIQE